MVTVYRVGDKVKGRYAVKAIEIPLLVESILEGMMDQSGRIFRISRFRTFRVVIGCLEKDLVEVDFDVNGKIFFKNFGVKGEMLLFSRETSMHEFASLVPNNLVLVQGDKCYMLHSNADVELSLDIPTKSIYDLQFDGVPIIDYDTEEVKEDGESKENVRL